MSANEYERKTLRREKEVIATFDKPLLNMRLNSKKEIEVSSIKCEVSIEFIVRTPKILLPTRTYEICPTVYSY